MSNYQFIMTFFISIPGNFVRSLSGAERATPQKRYAFSYCPGQTLRSLSGTEMTWYFVWSLIEAEMTIP